jgi:nucleoid DNA-binding protein
MRVDGVMIKRMRRALLEGQAVIVPGVGELSVRETRRYALVNPANGQALELGGERTLLFRPDRDLVRALNAPAGQGGAEDAS